MVGGTNADAVKGSVVRQLGGRVELGLCDTGAGTSSRRSLAEGKSCPEKHVKVFLPTFEIGRCP